jgi:UDPglucose 6-dehydrogenase
MKELGKPEPDSDVINPEPKVLLIGYGWVGQFCGTYFKNADIVDVSGYVKKTLDHYDLGIISVPTPMSGSGQCDVSVVDSVVEKYKDVVDIFLIKSTVEIGTTDRLLDRYKIKVCMSPEYIGETLGHPLLEPKRNAFQIIGGERNVAEKVAEYWRYVLNAYSNILIVTAREAEAIKYLENYYMMRSVEYWNEVWEVSRSLGLSFTSVREGLLLDPRVSKTHSLVYPSNLGWSGKCLPKDMNALSYTMRESGHPLEILEHMIEHNAGVRKDYIDNNKLKPDRI